MHSWGGNVPNGHINHHSEGNGIFNNSVGVTCDEGFGQEYHTFGWEWTDDWSQFYCDGKKTWYFEHATSKYNLFDKPCFLILSLRSGFYEGPNAGVGYGGDNTKMNPFFMDETMESYSDTVLVDYIHIYQKDNGSIMYIKK
jgi:beta-glucanase (GH16 family)